MYKKYIEMYGMGEWYNYQLSKLTCSSLYHATVDGNAEMVTYSATYINVVYIITEGYGHVLKRNVWMSNTIANYQN